MGAQCVFRADIYECAAEELKVVACALEIKPCDVTGDALPLCHVDCLKVCRGV